MSEVPLGRLVEPQYQPEVMQNPTPEQRQSLQQRWEGLFEDPRVVNMLSAVGGSLLQPRAVGQTIAGQFGNALTAGQQAFGATNAAQQQAQQRFQENLFAERGLDLQERQVAQSGANAAANRDLQLQLAQMAQEGQNFRARLAAAARNDPLLNTLVEGAMLMSEDGELDVESLLETYAALRGVAPAERQKMPPAASPPDLVPNEIPPPREETTDQPTSSNFTAEDIRSRIPTVRNLPLGALGSLRTQVDALITVEQDTERAKALTELKTAIEAQINTLQTMPIAP